MGAAMPAEAGRFKADGVGKQPASIAGARTCAGAQTARELKGQNKFSEELVAL